MRYFVCFIKSQRNIFRDTLTSALLLGVVFIPSSAHAGFLSDIFGSTASADSVESITGPTASNSQNLSLLEAQVSSASIVEDSKKDDQPAGSDKSKESPVKEGASVTINDNALTPATGPLGVSDGTDVKDSSFDQIYVYVVRPGDSMTQVAKMYDVSVNTIMWANDLKTRTLTVGQTLIILPFNGVKYTVKKGDTLKSIAKDLNVEVADITDYNELEIDTKLTTGTELIIPGAEVQVKAEPKPKTPKKGATGKTGSLPNNFYTASNTGSADGYYIRPLPFSCRTSQFNHDRYAVDISCGRQGDPILAAAAGKVILARMGYNGGFGNLVVIQHPNGTQTFYAHQSKLAVSSGDQVNQGQVIGYVGNTGRSTGAHLHFEVRGAKNPGFDRSGKSWKSWDY